MRPFAALYGLRVGCVQYLNAKPLIVPYDGEVIFEHPARLADLLSAGDIDIALIPVFEALRQPHFPIVDGVAIASRGPVYSVFLAYRGPLEEVRSISPDPASRTSNNLLRCLLAEFHGLHPALDAREEAELDDHCGHLLIGNQAIRYREQHHEGVRYLDLGQEWLEQTGLPFVFAVWQVRPEVANPGFAADALRAIKEAGIHCVREIALRQQDFAPAFAELYLTHHIKFDLGEDEKSGAALFRSLLGKHGLLSGGDDSLRFV